MKKLTRKQKTIITLLGYNLEYAKDLYGYINKETFSFKCNLKYSECKNQFASIKLCIMCKDLEGILND